MKKKIMLLSALVLATTMVTGCGSAANGGEKNESAQTTTSSTDEQSTSQNDTQARFDAAVHPVTELPQLEGVKTGDTIATIHTNMGDIKVWFFPEYAPKAVENFTTHATDGYYDGVIFHRIINNFMIQGGDPEGTGRGGESIWGDEFENEVDSNLRSFRGALCMANAGADTNGSQFYIVQNNSLDDSLKEQLKNLSEQKDDAFYEKSDGTKVTMGDVFPQDVIDEYVNNGGYPSLDFQYTIFGQVYEGMDVVDKIAAVQTDENDKPVEDVVIESIEVGTY
jgi:cyclophilin family peptidyl-prolyl cis-trans isomerase/outer membrane murein-binding lipoprotein Lpp